jgi:hypothetical protein
MALCGHNDCDSTAFAIQMYLYGDAEYVNWTSPTGTLVKVAYCLAPTDHIIKSQFGLGRGLNRIRNTNLPFWMDSGCAGSEDLGDWRFTRI